MGNFSWLFPTFPHFLLRLAHWLLAISNQLQRWMTSAAFQRLSMTQRKTLPNALLKFITDTDHFLFHAHYLKSPIVIQTRLKINFSADRELDCLQWQKWLEWQRWQKWQKWQKWHKKNTKWHKWRKWHKWQIWKEYHSNDMTF